MNGSSTCAEGAKEWRSCVEVSPVGHPFGQEGGTRCNGSSACAAIDRLALHAFDKAGRQALFAESPDGSQGDGE